MIKIFWIVVHMVMFYALALICMFTEVKDARKEISKNEKQSESKKEYYKGEKIMLAIIISAIVICLVFFVSYVTKRNLTVTIWLCGVLGIAYVYIAVRQIVKMLFIPEKRSFSNSDISNFTATYLGWWIIVLVVGSIEAEGIILEKVMPVYGQEVRVWIMFLWYFLNIMFISGGVYIVLCSLLDFLKRVVSKFDFIVEKIKTIVYEANKMWQRGEKYDGLKSYRLWKEHNNRRVIYKIFMTMPLLLFDTCNITCVFAKYFVRTLLLSTIKLIFDPVSLLYKCVKDLWNRYENNEWMHLLTQIAGVVSYLYVFLIIQHGEYEEVTKNVYEFFGTIFLLQYFTGKIVNMNKKMEKMKVNRERNRE